MENIDLTRFPSAIKPGTLVAMRDENVYRWALVLEKVSSEITAINKYRVITDRNKKADILPSAQLFISNDNLSPNYEDGVNYSDHNCIEEYIL